MTISGSNGLVEIPGGTGSPVTVETAGTQLEGVAVDGNGNIFVSAQTSNTANTASDEVVEFPSGGGPPVVLANEINAAGALVVDGLGNVYVTDIFESSGVILEIGVGGTTTSWGTGLLEPLAVAVDGGGNIFIGDIYESSAGNRPLFKIQRTAPPTLKYTATEVGKTSIDSPHQVQISNTGNATLTVTGPTFPADFVQETGGVPDCPDGFSLTPRALCNLRISFEPTASGPLQESAVLADNSLNAGPATQSLPLSGTGIPVSAFPVISSLSPDYGAPGAIVTVTGRYFGATQGSSTVNLLFYGPVTPSAWSDTSITFTLPAGAFGHYVQVDAGAQVSNAVPITVALPSSLTGISPTSGPAAGTLVTISGQNMLDAEGHGTVSLHGTPLTVVGNTYTSIQADIPPGATSGPLDVHINGVDPLSPTFTVTTAAPHISTLSANYGALYALITVNGTNFGPVQATNTVTFNGLLTTPTAWSNTGITVSVPWNATSGNVVVTGGGVASNGVPFTVVPTPSITGISPGSGPVTGTLVTIYGTSLMDAGGRGTVYFNGLSLPILNDTGASLQIQVPANFSAGAFDVHINGVGMYTPTFTVTAVPAPTIRSLSADYGAMYAIETVMGTNFGATQGSSTVTFNGIAAHPTAWSNTGITLTVPYLATTGNIVVTVGGQASNVVPFSVELSPSITSFLPASGPVGSVVTISGQNLVDAEGHGTVSFNGRYLPVLSDTGYALQVLIPAGGITGTMNVHINGVGMLTPVFTVTSGIPPLPNFPNGFDGTGMVLNGGPLVYQGQLYLTAYSSAETRSAFFDIPVNVQHFQTSFDFVMSHANGSTFEGITFTIQAKSPTALGMGGKYLGYSSIPYSVAVKFEDINGFSLPEYSSTGMYTDGATPWLPDINLNSKFISFPYGGIFNAKLTYDGTTLTVVITDKYYLETATQTYTVDIPATVDGPTAYVGFTGSTDAPAAEEIYNWTYSN